MPVPTVQVLLDDGTSTWQHDVTSYVRLVDGIGINRGRQDEFADVQPSTCSLTLDNTDGHFTPTTVAKPNLLGNGGFEVSAAGWFVKANVTSLVRSTAQAHTGAASLAVTSSGGAATFTSHRFAVTTGGSYSAMAKFRAATTGRQCNLFFRWYDARGTALTPTVNAAVIDATGTWMGVLKTGGVAPATAIEAVLEVRIDATAAAEVHYFDSAYVALATFTGADVYLPPSLPTRIDTGVKVRVTVNGVTTDRFTGFVQSWDNAWPNGGENFATVTISATDRLARLSRRKLRSTLENTILQAKPCGYYLLSEAAGSTSAGDSSGSGLPALAVIQKGTGGTLEFGAGTGPGTDGLTAAKFAPAGPADGLYLQGSLAGAGFGNAYSYWVRCAFSTVSAARQMLVYLRASYGNSILLDVYLDKFMVTGNTFSVTGGPNLSDGLVHDLAFVADAGTSTAFLYVDGVQVATAAYPSYVMNVATFNVGGSVPFDVADGSISHVAFGTGVPSAATVADWHTAGADGFAADSSDERIERYAAYAKIDPADLALETGDLTAVTHLDTRGASPISAMQKVASSEQGILFVNGAGQLVFHARSHRYSPTVAATLDAADIDPGSSLNRDTQGLINSVTASREGGATQVFEVASSVRKYEQYPSSLDLAVTTDDEALQAAAWVANTHAEPTTRLPGVPVDLMSQTAAFAATVQALELGAAVTVAGLPAQADATSLTLFVEGWAEQITLVDWTQTFNTSPLVTVWTIQDSVSGFIDSTFRVAY